MNKKQVLSIVMVCSICMFGFGFAKKDTVVAKVGRTKITKTQFDARVSVIPAEQLNDKLKNAVLTTMVAEELLLIEAKKEGIHRTKDFKDRIELAKNQLLRETVLKQNVYDKVLVTDQAIQNFYESKFSELFDTREIRTARHILFADKQTAEKVRRNLASGRANFSKMVEEHSTDLQTKQNGGSVGRFIRGGIYKGFPGFEKAAFSTKKGKYSDVIQTALGFHVIYIEEVEQSRAQQLEEVKEKISKMLSSQQTQQLMNDYVTLLKESIKVEEFSDLIISQPAPVTPPAPAAQ